MGGLIAFVLPVKLERGTDWAAWITAIATGVLAAGVIVAWFAVRDAKRTRHGQLVIALNQQWSSRPVSRAMKLLAFITDEDLRALVERLFDQAAPEATHEDSNRFESLSVVANLIETTGVLWNEKALDVRIIYETWGGGMIYVWSAWRLAAPRLRFLTDQPGTYLYFQLLAAELAKRDKKARPKARAAAAAANGASGSGSREAGAAGPGTNETTYSPPSGSNEDQSTDQTQY